MFWTVEWAGHSCAVQNALSAHFAVEHSPFGCLLERDYQGFIPASGFEPLLERGEANLEEVVKDL